MIKAGILGGGQLGRMLLQAAANYPVKTFVLENDKNCPAAHLCHQFTLGDIRNFDDVYNFGKSLDCLTIEIESVNVEALEKLESEGVKVVPKPAVLKIIKNKIHQKQFYKNAQIPSSPFLVTENLEELKNNIEFLPAVHKSAVGGYDGRGVQLISSAGDVDKGFDSPAVLEKMVDVKKEIAVIIAVFQNADIAIYKPVEMVFDPQLNLLSHQVAPAELTEPVFWKVEAIALKVVQSFNSPGVFAVELFLDGNNDVFVNETAPRVHNSGHHTIEACYSSQFDMLWRILLDYPPGNTDHIMPAAIVNLLGCGTNEGTAVYEGLQDVLAMPNTFVHIYGKEESKPGRKMGHVTIVSQDRTDLQYRINRVKNVLRVTA